MLNERKSWTIQEDQLLIKLYQENKQKIQNQTLHWNFISQKLNQLNLDSNRSGKQCRQRQSQFYHFYRWFNQLNPQLNKNTFWTEEDKSKLIQLHDSYGNRWAMIAKHFEGRTDNCIKNYMNSTLRKGLRILNVFVSRNRKFKQFRFRNIKEYKTDLLHKILFFSGSKNSPINFHQDFLLSTLSPQHKNKQQILTQVYHLAADIKKQLMTIQNQYESECVDLTQRKSYVSVKCFEYLIDKIHQINGICKKKKQKKSRTESKGYKKTNKKCLNAEFSTINFHSGPQPNAHNQHPAFQNQSQSSYLCPLNVTKINIQNCYESLYQIRFEKQEKKVENMVNQSINSEDNKFKLQQYVQNNSKKIDRDAERQSGRDKSVNLKLPNANHINSQYEITHNFQKQQYIKSQQHQASQQQKVQIQPLAKLNINFEQITTHPSISSLGQKSKDTNLNDQVNFFKDSQNKNQMNQQQQQQQEYEYFVFSESVDYQNYLPLYPVHNNSVRNEQKHNGSSIIDFRSINHCEDSDEEVI